METRNKYYYIVYGVWSNKLAGIESRHKTKEGARKSLNSLLSHSRGIIKRSIISIEEYEKLKD
jgi:hypothetical protein